VRKCIPQCPLSATAECRGPSGRSLRAEAAHLYCVAALTDMGADSTAYLRRFKCSICRRRRFSKYSRSSIAPVSVSMVEEMSSDQLMSMKYADIRAAAGAVNPVNMYDL
jgi:hypothetical protein